MQRRSMLCFATAAMSANTNDALASGTNVKMTTLYKLLTGDVQLRNKTPVKMCYLEHNFGPKWQSELKEFAQTLSAEQRALVERQLARIQLTRYTTRELAEYGGEGPTQLYAVSRHANVVQGKVYLDEFGP
uniref:ADNP homeobox protein 2 n=2 Tax=Lygus hesperus TaxID=30085 RepID=A0A0A9X9S1_LYGHE